MKGIDLTEIHLEPLLGKTKETRILDLVIPLNEGTVFTDKQVINALDSTASQITPFLDKMVRNGFLVSYGRDPVRYHVNPKSKRAWAIKNLLVSIYTDLAHQNSMKRLGIKKE